jgi:hypothetical protein
MIRRKKRDIPRRVQRKVQRKVQRRVPKNLVQAHLDLILRRVQRSVPRRVQRRVLIHTRSFVLMKFMNAIKLSY